MYLVRYIFFLDALLGSKRTLPFRKPSLSSVPNTTKLSETEGPLLTDEIVRFTGMYPDAPLKYHRVYTIYGALKSLGWIVVWMARRRAEIRRSLYFNFAHKYAGCSLFQPSYVCILSLLPTFIHHSAIASQLPAATVPTSRPQLQPCPQ
jgi:hypothetical protein